MPEVVLRRQTGARRVVEVPMPFPERLTVNGVRYIHQRHADPLVGRLWYVEAPEAPPLVRLCLHGCSGCGAVEPCGEEPCPGPRRVRRCAGCAA